MPSPFPGMDPWLEDPLVFPDLHDRLIFCISTDLNNNLPPGYAAISNARVYFEDEKREPDVSVIRKKRPSSAETQTAISLTGLLELDRNSDPIEEISIDILHGTEKRLVTSIEILSRANKIGKAKGRAEYLKKQRKMIRTGVNLVEIDLLRKGRHTTLAPIVQMRERFGKFDYHVSVVTKLKRDSTYVAPIKLADRLPKFSIPLDPGVAPVLIDLQSALDRSYESSRYPMFVDYTKQPSMTLTDEQYRWARKILKKQGRH